jgi:hypothetical protein
MDEVKAVLAESKTAFAMPCLAWIFFGEFRRQEVIRANQKPAH